MNHLFSLLTFLLAVEGTCAFVVPSSSSAKTVTASTRSAGFGLPTTFALKASEKENQLKAASLEVEAKEKGIDIERGRNPDRPELPELKGDFDWDEKFGGDDDWITENVPGRGVLGEIELAKQVTSLTVLEDKWRNQRLDKEFEVERKLGWTERAEMYNGRFAMFFIVVGLATEAFTGFSFPAQVEEMLRIAGIVGLDD
jgi:hypothetical protein